MSPILLALLPIVIILLMLFLLKQSSLRAGITALLLTTLIALFSPTFPLALPDIVHATFKGTLISSLVAYVLLFGILLFHLMNESGLIQAIASFIATSTTDPVRQVLILVVAFSPLVESASGFGIAIIVIAPLLIELGFPRTKATLLSLLSMTAVPWGALATGTVIGANLGGLPAAELGSGSALLSFPTFFYFTLTAVFLVGGWQALKQKGLETITVTSVLAAGTWLFSTYVSVELAGVLAALLAILVELLFIRTKKESAASAHSSLSDTRSLLRAVSPYLFLTTLLVLSRFIPAVEQSLTTHAVIDLPDFSFRLPVLYSPGCFLLLTCLFTLWKFRVKQQTLLRSLERTYKQWLPVTISTTAFVAMAEIMAAAGMTRTLAEAAALAFGPAFLFLSPLIGGLGGFLTGSTTGANAMFMHLQVQTAHHLHTAPDLFAYAQNTSASHMTMSSPSRVLLGVSVAGIHSEENRMLRRIALIDAGALLLIIATLFVYSSLA